VRSLFNFVILLDIDVGKYYNDGKRSHVEASSMETRYEKGWRKLQEVDGEAGEAVARGLGGVAPGLARYIVEFAFGDVYCRPGLDLRQRQLVTVAALTTQGGCEPQLEVHVNAALNVGLTPNEVVEAMMHCSPYVGFPRVINAVKTAERVFAGRGVRPVWEEDAR
jgi:4-carboxymuconolactone decarboxylase